MRYRLVSASLLTATVFFGAAKPAQAQGPDTNAVPPLGAPPAAAEGTAPVPATAPAAPAAPPPSSPGATASPERPQALGVTGGAAPAGTGVELGAAPPLSDVVPAKPGSTAKFQITSANGEHSIEFHGLLDADGRFFLTDKGGVGTFLVRRARPIIDARVFRYYEFSLQADFAGSKFQLLDAYGNVHIWDEIQLRVGKGKAPVGLERLQSPRDTFFPEPAFPTLLVPNRDIGAMLHGRVADGAFEWQAGVFNGVPNGQSGETDVNDSKDVEGRVFVLPFLPADIQPLNSLGVGVAGTTGNQQGAMAPYVTPGQATFFAYNSNVQGIGRRWLVTPQAYYYYGPVGAMFEVVREKEHVQTPTANAEVGTTAWALQGSAAIGGKQSYKGMKVKHPLEPRRGGFGAFELGARWGDLRVGDAAFKYGFAKRDSAAQRATQWGLVGTWHLADGQHVRVSYERTNFRGGAPNGGDKKPELLLLARFQASF